MRYVIAVLMALTLPAAAQTKDQSRAELGKVNDGVASVYGANYISDKTASGEKNAAGGLTAAHRTFPFGTKVLVTNTRNGKTVVVRINDRGPFTRGRVIDLSPAAGEALGISGLAPVALAVQPN